MIVIIDAINGAGKTTLCDMIEDWGLKVFGKVLRSKYPDRDKPFGKEIYEQLKDGIQDIKIFAMMAHLNRASDRNLIKEYQNNPKNLWLIDRHYLSNFVYSELQGCDYKYLIELEREFIGFEDLGIILDLPPSLATQRIASRGNNKRVYEANKLIEHARSKYVVYGDLWNWKTIQTEHYTPQDTYWHSIKLINGAIDKSINSHSYTL